MQTDLELLPLPPGKYRQQQVAYCSIYSTDIRTIKRWISAGRKALPQDFPPLDDAANMPAWWGRNMKWDVPAKILEAAKAVQNEQVASGDIYKKAGDAGVVEGKAQVERQDVGMKGALDRIREAEQAAHRKYMEAVNADDPNEGDIKLRLRNWTDISSQMRAMEKDSPDVLKASGELISKAEVREKLWEIHSVISQGFRAMIRRVRPKIEGLLPAQADEVWNEEVDRVFQGLRENEFTKPIAQG
jgi:hypothetical protein